MSGATGSYAPTTAAAQSAAAAGTSSLSGTGGNSAFSTTQIAVTPGSPGTPGGRDQSGATRNDPDYAGARGTQPVLPESKSVSDLIAALYRMSSADLMNLQTQLTQAGYGKITPTGMVDDATLQAYQGLLRDTAAYQAFDSRGLGQAYTPETLLQKKLATVNADGTGNGTVSGQALSDPLYARELVIGTLQSHLGRTPNPDEISQFTSALHGYEQTAANPDPSAYADAYATSTQGMANEQGAQNEVGFVKVLSSLVGGQ